MGSMGSGHDGFTTSEVDTTIVEPMRKTFIVARSPLNNTIQ
jgi:hypothetical protein